MQQQTLARAPSSHPLLSPLQLGPYRLPNRIVLAPLTRMRAATGEVPHQLNATYYAQRATAGLLITEASQVSRQGQGYPGTPGIHADDQVAGWRLVTDAVHAAGGRIFLQLWHVGRISHSTFQPDGRAPVAPSPVAPRGRTRTADGGVAEFETPRRLEAGEIAQVVDDFRRGAENALKAGFDGVEIHGANGYLVEQFLQTRTNQRDDAYGGSLENRARFLFEVLEAVIGVWGADRVGIRLSPNGAANDSGETEPEPLYSHVISRLAGHGLAYLHLIEPRSSDSGRRDAGADLCEPLSALPTYRPLYPGVLIAAGGFTPQTATEAVASGLADAVAFGRIFIANPDLPERIRRGAALNPYDRSTFYSQGPAGYTDYPALSG